MAGKEAEDTDKGTEEVPLDAEHKNALEAIRAENLSGRQLRIARKLAQRHDLKAVSDLDAVHKLRKFGIDPFSQNGVTEIGRTAADKMRAEADQANAKSDAKPMAKINPVPAPASKAKPPVDAPKPVTAREREKAIAKIQRDLAKRRRRRLARLMGRITLFVTIPTLIAGYYFYAVATPMYATHSEFKVERAQSPMAAATAGLFSGSPFASADESAQVQGYLRSREAMLRLDELHDLRAVYSDPKIDDIQRLPEDATNEEMFRMFEKRTKISFDPADGIMKMEIIAPSPEASHNFASSLLGFAEERVDQQSSRAREDQMRGARESFEDAERKLQEASARVVELQKRRGVLSAELEVTSQMSKITALETELLARESTLAELQANARPNQAKVDVQLNRIASLNAQIAELREGLTADSEKSASLAEISGELLSAQSQLTLRQEMLTQTLTLMESARVEANRQTIYLTPSVEPTPPDEPAYPRAFENTLVSFLVFAGIYLMLSMTASILREQVTN